MTQTAVDAKNSEFWNTLCGTNMAKELGVTDRSAESLAKFDRWFFDYYPYLEDHIPFSAFRGKSVLEVGLGYGSVAQRIGASGALYTGLDIAAGPVEMANYRLRLHNLVGEAIQGSILEAPFADAAFDYVVAIGCYHHTGNLQRAIDQSHRVLKPGGALIFMIYNGLSYRQWRDDWKGTLAHTLGLSKRASNESMRAQYDTTDGEAAPHTDFVSVGDLRRMCAAYSAFSAELENITDEPPFRNKTREQLLATWIPKVFGLDIYARASK